MDTDDEDLFAWEEDDNVTEHPVVHNPIEESLIKNLNEVENQINQAKKETERITKFTNNAYEKLRKKALYFGQDSSGSDTERYDEAGTPITKRKRKVRGAAKPALVVMEVWQRIIDDKWIIGVDLKNNSKRY